MKLMLMGLLLIRVKKNLTIDGCSNVYKEIVIRYLSHSFQMLVVKGLDSLVRSATTEARMYTRNIQKTENTKLRHRI